MGEQLYFAYGSNMNLDQMEFRCPDAEVAGNVRLEDYRLAFRGRGPGNGVATILPEEGSHVDGVLWKITQKCERSLDLYEGYPCVYGKERICVKDREGTVSEVMVYTMNAPYKDQPSSPSQVYLDGILEGCRQNGIRIGNVREAVKRTKAEEKAMKCIKAEERAGKPISGNRKKYRER